MSSSSSNSLTAQSQARSTEEEILRTLKSINRTAVETDQVSAATAEVIQAQGEQIDDIAKNASTVESNLNTSERLIRGLKGWGGRLANVLSGGGSSKEGTYPSYMPSGAVVVRDTAPTQAVVQPRLPGKTTGSEFDQEVDRHLDSISNTLGNIHARSLELSDAIARQVKTVEGVDRSVERSNDRMRRQHDEIKQFR